MITRRIFLLIVLVTAKVFGFNLFQRPNSIAITSSSSLAASTSASNDDGQAEFRDTKRRQLILSTLASACLSLSSSPKSAQASDVRAPLELLRPATRVKIYIDKAIDICSKASSDNKNPAVLENLKAFFAGEPIYMTQEEEKLSRRYLEIDTNTAWQKARLKEREARGAEMGIDYTTPYDKFNTALQRWGDNRQFQILRGRQRGLERSNAMRAAFNAYTNNLVFGDAYQLNVQGDAKKALIRNDALPNVNAVVVSDLDLRDLYRNQVLQNMDDAKAELDYQLNSADAEVDIEEILTYLRQAKASCQSWFDFIPKEDVDAAYQSVQDVKQ